MLGAGSKTDEVLMGGRMNWAGMMDLPGPEEPMET